MHGRMVQGLRWLALVCLLGQAWFLFGRSGLTLSRGLNAPWGVLGLTVVISLCAGGLFVRRDHFPRSPSRLWSFALSLALLALTWATVQGLVQRPSEQESLISETESLAFVGAVQQVEQEWGRLKRALPGIISETVAVVPVDPDSLVGGDLFRSLGYLREEIWKQRRVDGFFQPEAVVHRGAQRLAWTKGAIPLDGHPVLADSHGLAQGRRQWVWHELRSLGPGMTLEIQIPLPTDSFDRDGISLRWQVIPWDSHWRQPPAEGELRSEPIQMDPAQNLALVLIPDRSVSGANIRAMQALLMVAAGLAWWLALLSVTRLWWGRWTMLLAFWLGRVLFAQIGFFRLGILPIPESEMPAGPHRWTSLLDPAYFATPFAGGLFASTWDALLTAALVALTVWYLVQARGLAGRSPEVPLGWTPPLLGQGPTTGILFGLLGTLVMTLVRHLNHILATNANPRLIGEAVPLSFFTFWGLHLVLMLLAMAFFSLLIGVAVVGSWPERPRLWGWVFGGLLALGLAVTLARSGVGLGWWGAVLAGIIVLALWLLTPALLDGERMVRRFVWPVVLLLAAVWNYASLSEIYQAQEVRWLQGKVEQLVGPRNPHGVQLLRFALDAMRQEDGMAPQFFVKSADVWQDEAAFRLWWRSSLRDLGYPLTVEITDETGQEESFFSTGQAGTQDYQVVGRRWVSTDGWPPLENPAELYLEMENRLYHDGHEWVLIGQIRRKGDRGWILVEIPERTRRLTEQLAGLTGRSGMGRRGGYRPRSEVDQPILLLHGDDLGWMDVGPLGVPAPQSRGLLEELRRGEQPWARIKVGDQFFLCLWQPVPQEDKSRPSPGEGYLLGLGQTTLPQKLLDVSRLVLLNLVFLGLLVLVAMLWKTLRELPTVRWSGFRSRWQLPAGFQERFLTGYLFFGLLLLLTVGAAVDQMGKERIQNEAAHRTRMGLDTALQQLRGLLVEQARAFSRSDHINDMILGQADGQGPVEEFADRHAMVFDSAYHIILDQTGSDLDAMEIQMLLAVGRTNPMLMMQDRHGLYAATVIPIDLSDVSAIGDSTEWRGDRIQDGFFLYRQRLDRGLLGALADLVQGEATLRLGGVPVLASHPEGLFSGSEALLADPVMMAVLLDHGQAAGVFAEESRPFAFLGAQPLPFFRGGDGGGVQFQKTPAVLALAFPDRERQYEDQRRQTNLFLAGLANLVLLTALFLALLMSWSLFRPLRLLLTATRSMGRGDFHAPLPEAGKDEVGRLSGAFAGMRADLSEAREELESRERFLSLVLQRVTVGVAVLDHDDHVVTLNPAGHEILREFDPDLPEDQGALNLRDRFIKLAAGRQRWGGETRSADGLRTLRGAMAPLELSDGRTDIMLVFEDITEFLKTRKMAINAELARQVAHEIKNPLTPIQLSVQLLQQAWQDQHPQLDKIVPDTVQRVLGQVDLLRTIASEFSLLGRPGELERVPTDFLTMVRATVARYGADGIDAPLGLDLDAPDLPLVLAHEDSLHKILGNLMQNSLDAVPEERRPAVVVRWRVEPERVVLLWSDNGTGLDPEVADRLFDPYFSTKSKGTGLGLAICRNLADRMGGGIVLRNRPEAPGALAELSLPRTDPEGPAS